MARPSWQPSGTCVSSKCRLELLSEGASWESRQFIQVKADAPWKWGIANHAPAFTMGRSPSVCKEAALIVPRAVSMFHLKNKKYTRICECMCTPDTISNKTLKATWGSRSRSRSPAPGALRSLPRDEPASGNPETLGSRPDSASASRRHACGLFFPPPRPRCGPASLRPAAARGAARRPRSEDAPALH